MIRKIFIGLLATLNIAVGSFAGYAWWTRRSAPSFSRGGAFGMIETPAPSPTPTQATRVKSERIERNEASTPGALKASNASVPNAPGTRVSSGVHIPKPGTYRFNASGRERIEFGGTSPCAWDLGEVSSTIKPADGDIVMDTTYSAQRQERIIFRYDATGLYTTFVGAAVTCGIRNESEGTYDPPGLRVKFPLRAGTKWSQTTGTPERVEKIRGEIIAKRSVRVPAGTFTAWEIHMLVDLSGEQNGTYDTTFFFAPALGLSVKEHSVTDVTARGGRFTSDIRLELRTLPG